MPDTDTPALTGNRSPLVQELLEPIAPGNPAGDDVTYDDSFQRLKGEIDKLESASTGGVDYELVVQLARDLLKGKSKDLRAATYLAMGLVHTRGLQGAADGVAVIDRMLRQYWEEMHPPLKRIAARRNSLQALSDRLKEWVAAEKPAEADREALEQAVEDMQELQAFVMDRMADDAPAISGLVKAFEEALRKVPKPQAAPAANTPAPPAPAPGAPAPAFTPPAAAPPSLSSGDGDFRSAADAERTVFRVAAYLRESDRANPIPYHLVRAVRWGDLEQEPPNEKGRTMIPAPIAQRRSYLAGLLERGDHRMLLEEAESSFQEAPFWLDLQRFATLAADGLGASFAGVRDAVLYELAVLLRRFGRLTQLQFSDGTPFADATTIGWIELRVSSLFGGAEQGQATAHAGAGEGMQALLERYREARGKLAESDLGEAIRHMSAGTETDGGEKDRFRRRLYTAALCISGGQALVARPVLEELSEAVRRHGLEEWDPALALEVYTTLHKCYDLLAAGAADGELRERARETFALICRLDPRQGLVLAGK